MLKETKKKGQEESGCADISVAFRHHQSGRLQEAQAIYHNILQDDPKDSNALHLLGVIAHQAGRNDEAADLIGQAIASNPHVPDFHRNLGSVLCDQERLEMAVASYQRAIELKPDYTEAHYNLGNVLNGLRRYDEAIVSYKRTIEIKPDYAEACNNLGSVFNEKGLLNDAAAFYRKALALNPDYSEAHNNLGVVFLDQRKLDDAIKSFGRAIKLRPDYAKAYVNLAIAFSEGGRIDDAISCYRWAIKLKPKYPEAYNNLGNALKFMGKMDEALASYKQALAIKPDFAEAHSNLLFLFGYNVLLAPDQMLHEHRRWDQIHGGQQKLKTFVHDRVDYTDKRLRIGYVSPDLQKHSVSNNFEPILDAHDRSRVEVFCYAEVKNPDEVTERLKSMADGWRFTVGLSDEKVAQIIYDDRIDVLIDLAGHTANSRIKVFTLKPAPVQATYMGYFTTTGLEAMDYWITDEVTNPVDTIEQAVETIYRLPRSSVCYRPSAETPDVAQRPGNNTSVTFGCFNDITKAGSASIELWSQLLRSIPDSRLLLKAQQLSDSTVRKNLLKLFGELGVSEKRLTFLPKTRSYYDHMATYGEVDIALDTIPRTGGITTAEALWMGVPVITLAGKRFIERLSASMITAIGMTEWIASTPDEYVGIAVHLVENIELRSRLRRNLRSIMKESPMCDARNLAVALEDAYRKMWNNFLVSARQHL